MQASAEHLHPKRFHAILPNGERGAGRAENHEQAPRRAEHADLQRPDFVVFRHGGGGGNIGRNAAAKDDNKCRDVQFAHCGGGRLPGCDDDVSRDEIERYTTNDKPVGDADEKG